MPTERGGGSRGGRGVIAAPGRKFGGWRGGSGVVRAIRSTLGTLNMTLAGVSRDSTGAALGNCRVMIYRTEDMSFVMETTSDGSGNWSVSLLRGGPFFLVEYLVGSPDRAGTSKNTLAPVPG
jgi:hypothetical protein